MYTEPAQGVFEYLNSRQAIEHADFLLYEMALLCGCGGRRRMPSQTFTTNTEQEREREAESVYLSIRSDT